MSDPRYGEPVDETTPSDEQTHVDDVVQRANAGLADAEAASRDAVETDTTADAVTDGPESAYAAAPPTPEEAPVSEDTALEDTVASEPAPAEPVVPVETVAVPAEPVVSSEPLYRPELAGAGAVAGAVTASEPVAPVAPAVPQPIFVQAPEAPRPRGNRGAVGLIGLLAAVAFAILYFVAGFLLQLADGAVTVDGFGTYATDAATSWALWVPVAVFFLGFWVLGAIINRGRWGQWVIFGLLIGFVAYGGHLLGQLFEAPFWTLTASQGSQLVQDQLLAPLAVLAFVFGRELTIWFGAWAAARGRRITELNNEAQREYERTLEAGPQLHHL